MCVLGPTFAFEFVWVKADCDELPQTDQQNSWEIFSLLLGCQKSAPNQTGEERNAPRGAANARPTRLRRRRTWSTTKQRCRDGGITFEAGLVADEELRADRSVAASRGARIGRRYWETVLADWRLRANGLSGDSLAEIQRAWHVLGRIARAHELDHELRTALRLRMRALVDRLSGAGAAADRRGEFRRGAVSPDVPRERPWKLRLAQVALLVSPRLMRAAFLRMRPLLWKARRWLPADGHPAARKTNIGRTPDVHELKRSDISLSMFPRIYIGRSRADR